MKLVTKTTLNTIGNSAYQAIEKHFEKTLKWEKTVKKDEDPEALHQMRVGLRRLRTAISRFEIFLSLPKSANQKNIGKIGKVLGSLRDLDVLKELLENNYQPHLSKQEQKSLVTVFSDLAKHRQIAVTHVQKTFKHEAYKDFKHELQGWLEKPSYQVSAFLPVQQVLPDLLLPEISQLFLHPGWLIGTQVVDTDLLVQADWTSKELEHQLQIQGETLHSLRKQAKRVRYQMELFSDLYGKTFATDIEYVKNVQEILGMIQDSIVLNDWLENIFLLEMNDQLGGLAHLLTENRYQLWQQWRSLQAKFLQSETRQSFRLAILQVKESGFRSQESGVRS